MTLATNAMAFAADPISWTPCSLNGKSNGAECATIPLPLNYDNPKGKQIGIAVKRVLGTTAKRKQIWLIEGGPGDSSQGVEPLAQSWSAMDSSIDFYVRDHRGVNGSGQLTCPAEEQNQYTNLNPLPKNLWPACLKDIAAQWGADGVKQFSASNAARDLQALINLTRAPMQEVDVVGLSYGTFLVQRYLQIAPNQADAVVLDAVGHLGSYNMYKWDQWHDEIGKKVMLQCSQDSFCKSQFAKLGTDPMTALEQSFQRMRRNQQIVCGGTAQPSQMAMKTLQQVLALVIDSPTTRVLIPSVIYRTWRCNDNDVTALNSLNQRALAKMHQSPPPGPVFSEVLQNIIVSSEELRYPLPSAREISTIESSLDFTAYSAKLFYGYAQAAGRIYPPDHYYGKYPHSDLPMLLLNGDMDSSTPVEQTRKIAAHYTKPNQNLVVIPGAGHVTMGFISDGNGGQIPNCSMSLMQAFLKNPRASLNKSCAQQPAPAPDFRGSAPLAQEIYGPQFTDLWE